MTMSMVLTEGPLHTYSEFSRVRPDIPSPDLEPGQSALTVGCYKKTIDTKHGTWKWVAEWEILENR